jgi:hypothetical protein
MIAASVESVVGAVAQAVASLDFERISKDYWEQNEFVYLEGFLSETVVVESLLPDVVRLKPKLNRNYIPGHKKGGSVSYYTVREEAPGVLDLYRSPAFIHFLSRLVDRGVMLCPDNDPHAARCTITPSRAIISAFTTTRPTIRAPDTPSS